MKKGKQIVLEPEPEEQSTRTRLVLSLSLSSTPSFISSFIPTPVVMMSVYAVCILFDVYHHNVLVTMQFTNITIAFPSNILIKTFSLSLSSPTLPSCRYSMSITISICG